MTEAEIKTRRTFRSEVERRPGTVKSMLDDSGQAVVIHAEPLETPNGDGTSTISMGFPVLIVTGWVNKPEQFAEAVAALLSEHLQ